MTWRDLLWPSEPRLSAVREQIAALQADMKPPVKRFAVPDGRERMQGRVTISNWERYQLRARQKLRDEQRRVS